MLPVDHTIVMIRSFVPNREFLQSLLKEILTKGKEDRESELHGYYRVCTNRIKVKGWRKGSEPPLELLVPSATRVISGNNEAFFHFLFALLKLEEETVNRLRELGEAELGREKGVALEPKVFQEEVRTLAAKAREELGITWDDDRLSLVVAATLLIGPPADLEQENEAAAALQLASMTQVLEAVRSVDAQDPFWSHLDVFFDQVSRIREEKQDDSSRKLKLEEALGAFQNDHGEYLSSFFRLANSHWTWDRLRQGKLDAVLANLDSLTSAVGAYRELNAKHPANITEAQERRNELGRLEEEVYTSWNSVNECFQDPAPDPEPDQDEHSLSEQAEPVEEGGLADSGEADVRAAEETFDDELSVDEPEAFAEDEEEPEEQEQGQEATDQSLAVETEERSPETEDSAEGEVEPEAEFLREDKVMQMLEAGDFAGAYWVALAREKRQMETPLPSWLLAAMESVRYLLMPGFPLTKQFTYPINHYFHGDPFAELCAVGVGLVGALLEPASNSVQWLFPQENLPNLQRIINVAKDFAQRGIPLSRRDLLLRSSQRQRERMIKEASQHCRHVVNNNAQRRFGLPRVNRVWRKLFAEGEELRQVLQQAALDQREHLPYIKEVLQQWSSSDSIAEQIERIDSKVKRRKDPPLAGHEFQRLERIVGEVVQAAQEWAELVEHGSFKSGDSKQGQIRQLTSNFEAYLEPCIRELEAAEKLGGKERFAYRYIIENLNLIADYVRTTGMGVDFRLHWALEGATNIEQILAKRLLWCPALELDDSGLPTVVDLERLDDCLDVQPRWEHLTRSVVDAWLEKLDFRFLDSVIQALDEEDEAKEKLRDQADSHLQGSRDSLEERIRDTSVQIEATLVNVGLTDEQHSELKALVEGIDVRATETFLPAFRLLDQVNEELKEAERRRLQHQKEIWAELWFQLEEATSAEKAEQFRQAVQEAMEVGDTRVIDEYISVVRGCLERGEEPTLPALWESKRDYLQEFSEFRRELSKEKMAKFGDAYKAAKEQKTWAGLQYGAIPTKQLELIERGFTAWRSLSQQRKMAQSIRDLFTFLGFTVKETVEDKLVGNDHSGHIHLSLKMDVSDQARPFPDFGSQTSSFNVLVVWERPGADNLGTAVKEARLEGERTIVLYFGRIADSIRREITRMTRRRNLSLAVLDETLFLFLTGERDARLRAFLHCSVPYGTTMPYKPELMGDAPPEVFYGRERAADMLARRDGSCLVYGGRQMGKSALLRYVERRFHNPERRRYAWVEDIKNVGSSTEETSRIWRRLWNHMSMSGLVIGNAPSDEEIVFRVGELFKKDEELHILLMLDEADNFLNRDAMDDFKEVSLLRKLMTDTQRRFKVVFAGLHHVQRFQSMPNQPLAHFGVPILVGPLEERDAVDLVREPLQALGFELDNACIYRILSFTNYHPGLIQFFCKHLLERLYKKHEQLPSPYRPIKITRKDVEYIYLQDDVRDRIRERFEWTLDLDTRYQVIVWSIIEAQMEIRDSFSKEFSVGELFSQAKDFWPAEFGKMDSDEFRGLLRELAGLGVLTTPGGRYRLKSPNLVRIMGDEGVILEKLYDFVDRPARDDLEPNSFHERIDVGLYSAFTFAQARSIDREHDFRLITASRALGLEHVEESVKHLYAATENTVLKRIPISVDSAGELERLISKEQHRAKKAGKNHVVLYQIVDKQQVLPLKTMKAAYEHYSLRVSQERQRTVSFFFVVNPMVYWALRQADAGFIDNLDSEGLLVTVKPWDQWGIGQRLDNENKLNNEETRKAILEAGGAWPCLLNEILRQYETTRDMRTAAGTVLDQLQNNQEFRRRFLDQLELPQDPVLDIVVKSALSFEEPVPVSWVSELRDEQHGQIDEKRFNDAVE
ncbi:MAG: hypothetical protein QM373_02115, partial [Bacillota bacterium]|nr:hypothetical protein [Bacillota bacterium]